MTEFKTSVTARLLLIVFAILATGSAIADKPSWTGGGGKQEKHQQKKSKDKQVHKQNEGRGHYEKKYHNDKDYSGGRYFIDQQRTIIHDYYASQYRSGHCPPGLAKKHNGCMPPGQAKKWAIGRPLPRDVVYYDLPPTLIGNIGMPPAGYRFVRVANDILMISIGTGMVMDAINDLGRY